jgi:hypothetical protein
MAAALCSVVISHLSSDTGVAKQLAANVKQCGAGSWTRL